MAETEARTSVIDNPDRSRFEILLDGISVGYANYRLRPGRIVFTHTEIQPEFEGRGLGGELAESALDAARERGLAVQPDCPFIAGYIGEHPEYADLVKSDQSG